MRNLIFIWMCLFLVIPSQARTITVDNDGPPHFNNIQAAAEKLSDPAQLKMCRDELAKLQR